MTSTPWVLVSAAALVLVAGQAAAQPAAPIAPRPPAESWWMPKAPPAAYPAPGRPIWRLADLLRAHRGQHEWQQLVVSDPHQRAVYHSAAPGTAFPPVMHPVTQTMFVVTAGKVRFTVESQGEVIASRGSVVNILDATIYSIEILPGEDARWVEIDPAGIVDIYPQALPPPGRHPELVKVTFARPPRRYTAPNQLHWNLFDAAARCEGGGVKLRADQLNASQVAGYLDPADPANHCPRGGPPPGAPAAIVPGAPFGHIHSDMAEWWIIQSGGVAARFEGQEEIHAVEGDILYAPQMAWHQLRVEGPGLSSRLAITAFPFINMNSVPPAAP